MGDPNYNVDIKLAFGTAAGFDGIFVDFSGTYVDEGYPESTLQFDLGGYQLDPGTYWISAWVVRPYTGGSQWYWKRTTPIWGSEEYFHNPGGGFGLGTDPVPGGDVFGEPADMAFLIEGVPEPASLALLALVGGLLLRRR